MDAMARTLVISDLHLGSRVDRDVLRAPVPRGRLLRALADVDRLVLLGDVLELTEARPRDAMAIAEPVLRDIGGALGPGREIVLLAGNHDRLLIRDWLRAPRRLLRLDSVVPPDASTLLERVVGWLGSGGATVTVRYPGVWIEPGIWASHGHYLDRHLLPESAFGIARGLLGRLPRDGAAPMEYEQRSSATAVEGPFGRLLPRWLSRRIGDLGAAARRATMAGTRVAVGTGAHTERRARLRSRLLGLQMLRASIPAYARVVHRLGVDAEHVLFGHVHRAGPRTDDDPSHWAGPDGTPRIWNTGCWVHEPLLLHRADPSHVYWPGGALLVQDGVITVLSLLDDLAVEQLR